MNKFELKILREKLKSLGALRSHFELRTNSKTSSFYFNILTFFQVENFIFVVKSSFNNHSLNEIIQSIEGKISDKRKFVNDLLSTDTSKDKIFLFSDEKIEEVGDFIYTQIKAFCNTPFEEAKKLDLIPMDFFEIVENELYNPRNSELSFLELYNCVFNKLCFRIDDFLKCKLHEEEIVEFF